MSGKRFDLSLMAIVLVVAACCSAVGAGGVCYVSPEGNDAWSGGLAAANADGTDGPVATVARALEMIRAWGSEEGSKEIKLLAGRYLLEAPLVLGPEDSGVVIGAAGADRPVLSGGVQLTGWEPMEGGLWSAPAAGVREGTWDFRALIVNGRYCSRARLPETGAFEHESVFDVAWMSTTGGGWQREPTELELTTLEFREVDLPADLEVRNAEVTVYHMWDESMVGLKGIDWGERRMTFSSPLGHPSGAFGVRKYVVWNVREGMTRPGQWYLDRAQGRVVYWPLAGENPRAMDVIAPRLESVIRLIGRHGEPVRDVRLEGLTIEATTTPLKAGGFGAGAFAGAVEAAQARDCQFVGLEVRNVAGQGIQVHGGGVRIVGCRVHQVGACGIRAAGCEVTDNLIHHVGLTYPSAIGLVGGGANGRYLHNEIHHTPYSAINCGGENHRIEGNLIYQAMLELHDGGGIYCFAGKNTVLRGNFIRDIPDTGGYGSSAYYLDERSEGCLVEGNLSVNVARPSHNHMAHGNTIRGNVFVTEGDLQLTFQKSDGYRVEENLMIAGGDLRISNIDGIAAMSGNVFCLSDSGRVVGLKMSDYQEDSAEDWSDGYIRSARADVLIEGGRVRPVPGSALADMGFPGLDVSNAGPRGDWGWE